MALKFKPPLPYTKYLLGHFEATNTAPFLKYQSEFSDKFKVKATAPKQIRSLKQAFYASLKL